MRVDPRSVTRRFLRFLPPLQARRLPAGVWCWLVRAFWLAYFAFVVLILALRYLVLPNVEDYRPQIERQLGQALGLQISIGRLEASWAGVNPKLALLDVRIADAAGRPALAFSQVKAVLSWWSLPASALRLRLLQIDEPTLHLRRDEQGRFFVAGLPVSQDGNNTEISDWVLSQKRIRITGATIVWEDGKRGAPPLILEDVSFALDNSGRQHRFGLTAVPPPELAARIDLRGDFRGRDLDKLATWKGDAFVQIDYADLAGWRAWVDYPVALPRGHGAMRVWATFAAGSLQELTADLALRDVVVRLATDLPALELDRMSGRIGASFLPAGARVTGQQVALASTMSDGHSVAADRQIRMEPTDFRIEWERQSGVDAVRGSATASSLDLGATSRLAAHLPLDDATRRLLAQFAPSGRASELRTTWVGNAQALEAYSLKGFFTDLALRARGDLPGVSGLSGRVELSEAGGSANVRSEKAVLDLPHVFPEPSIAFDTLRAQIQWTTGGEQLEVELTKADFSSADAAGSAQGIYRYPGHGLGSIDLSGVLTRADARAVWRYLPHAVGAEVRDWLRKSLKSGRASEAKVILQGDLDKFPFSDSTQGRFLVSTKAHDVTLHYGDGWPPISGIDADLRFAGASMLVQARRGSILNVALSDVRAEIADFAAQTTLLKVRGKAEGETAQFLRFIEQSPLGEQTDHFARRLAAVGRGRLEIGFDIPLASERLVESRVKGTFALLGNEATVDPSLPPLRQLTGNVHFSEKDVQLAEVQGQLFGGPVKIGGGLQGGKLLIAANGMLSIEALRQHRDLPLLEHLSGKATYRVELRSRKGALETVIDGSLAGVASTLPEPLSKPVGEELPFRLEHTPLPAGAPAAGKAVDREQWVANVGDALSLHLIRRKNDDALERGALAIGQPLPALPERGMTIAINGATIDLDQWQRVLHAGGKKGEEGGNRPLTVDLKARELVVLGKHYNDVRATLAGTGVLWRGSLQAREAAGTFQWDESGAGKLTARFKRWRRPEKETIGGQPDEGLDELPALDVVVDDFVVGTRRLGHVEVLAHNDRERGVWRLDRVLIINPFGRLTGSGDCRTGSAKRTQLDFSLESGDTGKLLDRLGYPDAVRGGSATLAGSIGWNGPPAALDYETLSGEMKLQADKGQFVKLDPGAAGKLLGLISLQALPRRVLLDFGDLFSEGLAFDRISGTMTVKSGLMRTDRLQIEGPSARVVMRGEADLRHETTRLHVTVQPELGGSAALGVAVVNPLAGVATLLAHRMLQNPLNRIFSVEYLVTGKWDDPKVEKLSAANQPTTPP